MSILRNLFKKEDFHFSPALLTTIEGHNQRDLSLAISSDGRWLASVDDSLQKLTVINLQTNGEMQVTSDHACGWIAFSPDGKYFAAVPRQGEAVVWDTQTWKTLYQNQINIITLDSVEVSPQSNRVAIGSYKGGKIFILDLLTSQIRTIKIHGPSVIPRPLGFLITCRFSPDGQKLFSVGDDGCVFMTVFPENRDGKEYSTLLGRHNTATDGIAISADGTMLATSSRGDGIIEPETKIWNASSGGLIKSITGGSGVHLLRFSDSGHLIASTYGVYFAWNCHNWKVIAEYVDFSGTAERKILSRNGKYLALYLKNKNIEVWQMY